MSATLPKLLDQRTRVRVGIDLACNDPDSGDFIGRISHISVPALDLDLVAKVWGILSFRGCPKLDVEDSTFTLSGKRWGFKTRTVWYGNWCWDRFWMDEPTAQAFLAWVHRRDMFQCEASEVRFGELWDNSAPLAVPPDLWRELVGSGHA